MSEKRTSPESSQEDLDPLFQHDDDCKRVKLTSQNDTKLEDLPLEMIHRIFITTITMEVGEMHLAKSAWKEKADLVMSRLKTVCPQWNNILKTDSFQNELYRTLDRTVEKTMHLEIVQQSPIYSFKVHDAITFKDELFVLREDDRMDFYVDVYDRNNLAGTRDVIDLGLRLHCLASCRVSNCLYLFQIPNAQCRSNTMVARITKKDEHKFEISTLIIGWWEPDDRAIAANGNIILYKLPHGVHEARVVVYDANGDLQRTMKLPSGMNWLKEIVPMPSGNLLLVSGKDKYYLRMKLTEMDMKGTVLRQYESSLGNPLKVYPADQSGRVVIYKSLNEFELLDKEFNLLNAIGPQLEEDKSWCCTNLHYCGEQNELVTILADGVARFLTLLQFTEK